jgi:hypothetical protein
MLSWEREWTSESWKDADDLLPIFSARVKLVESVFSKENGREEAVFGRADHWVPEAG